MRKIYEKMGQKWNNEYYDNGEHVILRISKEETKEIYDILLDYCDLEKVKNGQWYVYIGRKNEKRKDIIKVLWTVHRDKKKITYDIYQYILDSKHKELIVDHINRNRLDNRRSNLRFVTAQENSLNQDRIGHYKKDNDRYYTCIKVRDVVIYSGCYDTGVEAYLKYLQAHIVCNKNDIPFIKEEISKYNVSITEIEYDDFLKDVKYAYINNEKITKNNDRKKKEFKNKKCINSSVGYRYEEKHNKYLTRITTKDRKMVNIGRYKTEEEANEIYLKCCLILKKDETSSFLKHRIESYNIKLTEEDYNNKYIKKILAISKGEEVPKELNGKLNLDYEKNMNIIIDLVNTGKSWNYIANYLVDNEYMKKANGDTIKKYYYKYMNNFKIAN